MAFAKAKITRFNEIASNTPAPGSYNPNFEGKYRGTSVDNGSPTGSVASEKGSIKSVTSTPCFRTPVVPVRRKLLSQSARKATPKSTTLHNHPQEEQLKEIIVECTNKTETIKELEAQIEELKDQIASTKLFTQTVAENYNTCVEAENDQHRPLFPLQEHLEREIVIQRELYAIEISRLQDVIKEKEQQIKNIQLEKENAIQEIHEEKEVLLFEFEEKRLHLDSMLLETQEQLYDIQKENEDLIAYNSDLQNQVKSKNIMRCKMVKLQKRFQNLQQKLKAKQKLIAYLQKRLLKLHSLQCDLKQNHQNEIKAFQAKLDNFESEKKKAIETMELNFIEVANGLRQQNGRLDEQLRHLKIQLDENSVKSNLENQNLNLILSNTQRDLQFALSAKSNILIELNEKQAIINELQRKMSTIIVELNDTREQNHSELKRIQAEAENWKMQVRRYTIALDETRATVDVLKKRLVESDQGVEQLKSELNQLDGVKLKLENENYNLRQKMAMKSFDESEMNFVIDEVNKDKEYLNRMVESYKQKVLSTIKECDRKQEYLYATLNEREQEITKLQMSCTELKSKAESLEMVNAKLQQNNSELLGQLKVQASKIKEAQSLISATQVDIGHQEAENIELRFKVNRLELEVGTLRKQASDKTDRIAEENRKLKQKLEEAGVNLKYQQLLEKYKKEKQEMEQKINAQNKIIEKLKQTSSSAASPKSATRKSKLYNSSLDKENKSPGKAASIRQSSADSPTTPLKERNLRQ